MKPNPKNKNPMQSEGRWKKGGYLGLAEAIIYRATFDANDQSGRTRNDGIRGSSKEMREDARMFFNSEWFEVLANGAGYDPSYVRYNLRRMGLL